MAASATRLNMPDETPRCMSTSFDRYTLSDFCSVMMFFVWLRHWYAFMRFLFWQT